MGWHDGNSVRYIKSFVVGLLPPSEGSHGKGECSQWNAGCPFPVEGILRSKNKPWEVLLLLITDGITEMPFPILYTPWYQLKWLPQLQGTELAWAETNPAQHNWFHDVQWGTQSNWPFCRGNLLAYPAPSPPLPGKCYQALFVSLKPDSTASCSLWLALGWCQDEVRVLGHRANAVAVAVGSLPDAFSAHAHLPRESPLSVPYHTVPSFQFPVCPQKHWLTHYCSFSAAPQLYQDPQRILR